MSESTLCCVALKLGLGTHNPRFVAWPLNFASGGKSVTPPTDRGSMSRLMFGLTKVGRHAR